MGYAARFYGLENAIFFLILCLNLEVRLVVL